MDMNAAGRIHASAVLAERADDLLELIQVTVCEDRADHFSAGEATAEARIAHRLPGAAIGGAHFPNVVAASRVADLAADDRLKCAGDHFARPAHRLDLDPEPKVSHRPLRSRCRRQTKQALVLLL